jgi:hypothetical protein
MKDDADVGEELAAPTHEEESATQEIAGGAHPLWIDIGDRKGAAPEETAILWASIRSFLALPP